MERPQPSQVTQMLIDWGQGDKAALDQLMPVVYEELRRLAGSYLRRERPDHTLQPTALINEAYLRLIGQETPEWQSRAHFFGVAARLMRQILVDHARARAAFRRGGDQQKLSLEDVALFADEQTVELIQFDEALSRLASFDERKCQVVEMRAFGGLSVEETAEALGVSVPTVKREMRMAKAWLLRELEIKI